MLTPLSLGCVGSPLFGGTSPFCRDASKLPSSNDTAETQAMATADEQNVRLVVPHNETEFGPVIHIIQTR